MRLCMCKRGYVTWAGIHCCSWWSLQRSAPLASACTSWTDRGNRQSGPGPRQRADARKEKELSSYFHTWHSTFVKIGAGKRVCKDLSWVLVGRSEGAVRVSGVQTGPVHVSMADAGLFQHFLKAVHQHVWPFYLCQELLGVEAGPLKSSFTSGNVKVNVIRFNRSFVLWPRPG